MKVLGALCGKLELCLWSHFMFRWYGNLIMPTQQILNALKQRKAFLNGSILEYMMVASFFFIAVCFYTDFIILDIGNRLFTSGTGDGSGGFLWYVFAQPGLSLLLDHTNLVNYPYGEDIGGPTFITYLGLWLPLRILTFLVGPVVGVNIFMMFGFFLSAMSMYWLVKRLTSNTPVALFAGYALAFTPYTVQKALDHMPYILLYIFVFMIAAFIGLWRKSSWKRAVALGVSVSLAFYTDGYYILLASTLVVCLVLGGLIYDLSLKVGPGVIIRKFKMLCLAGLTALMLLAPVVAIQLFGGDSVKEALDGRRSDIAVEMQAYRANVIDFMLPAQTHPLLKDSEYFQKKWQEKSQRSNASESTTYSGYVIYILCGLGFILTLLMCFIKKNRTAIRIQDKAVQDGRLLLLAGMIFIVSTLVILSFMFSPEVIVAGVRFPLIGDLFIKYDISLWRVMTRFFVVLHTIWVLFAAITLYIVLTRIKFLNNKSTHTQLKVHWLVCIVLISLVGLEYATTANRPSFAFSETNKVYQWLKQQESIKSIAEVPVLDPMNPATAEYVTMQMIHGKKLLNRKENTSARVTNVHGSQQNRELVNWIYERGADAVVIRSPNCIDYEWGVTLYARNGMCVYRMVSGFDDDGLYVKYGKGFFNQTVKEGGITKNKVILEAPSAQLRVVDADFEPVSSAKSVKVKAELLNVTSENIQWSLLQEGVVVGSGYIEADNVVEMQGVIEANKSFTLQVKYKGMSDTTAGSISISSFVVQ